MQFKKFPHLSMHVDVDDFLPATDAEKEYMVQMRPSTTFFKDGVKRLSKNTVAMVSFFVIIIITLSSIFLPLLQGQSNPDRDAWTVFPYSYSLVLRIPD